MATVLLIEDEATIRQLIETALERNGYEVLSFSDAEPALKTLDFATIDLIITDLSMPMRGEEAIYTLRSGGIDIPIIILSGLVREQDFIPLHSIGANRILSKPFEVKIFLDTVRELLEPS